VRGLLLDTHAWAWSLTGDARLSDKARTSIGEAEFVFVSPISFFEIAQKVRLGKWPQMVPFIERLPALLAEQGGTLANLEPSICVTAGMTVWPHLDPFDRLLAATAQFYNLPLVSADAIFDGHVARVW
jgi:PIN domain nuclease of toxin-antitoxin system